MPSDVAIIVAAIVFAFLVFAAALAWGDYYTSSIRSPQTKE